MIKSEMNFALQNTHIASRFTKIHRAISYQYSDAKVPKIIGNWASTAVFFCKNNDPNDSNDFNDPNDPNDPQ